VPKLLRQHNVPGVSIAVVRDGTVTWAKGYGQADRDKPTAVTPGMRFQIGSDSKPLTAWGIMKLVGQGSVDLDAPVGRYLKRWQLPKSPFDHTQVTVRRVLSHTAGLSVRGYHGVFRPGEKLPALVVSLNGYSGSDGGLRVVPEPGRRFENSSGGSTPLQLLAEDVSGEPFAAYMRRAILDPLGMRNSGYDWSPELQAAVATPYNDRGAAQAQYQFVEEGIGRPLQHGHRFGALRRGGRARGRRRGRARRPEGQVRAANAHTCPRLRREVWPRLQNVDLISGG
jgi:CubicO group peptidase (beta-lactamase class C family)